MALLEKLTGKEPESSQTIDASQLADVLKTEFGFDVTEYKKRN